MEGTGSTGSKKDWNNWFQSKGRERNCVEPVNQASMVYNSKLSSSIITPMLLYLENYSEYSGLIHQYISLVNFSIYVISLHS